MATRVRLSQQRLTRYQDSLKLATDKFETEAKPSIERLRAYLRGEQWPATARSGADPGLAKLVVNLLFADVKVMLPVLALRNPRVFCKPVGATVRLPGPPAAPGQAPLPGPAAQLIHDQPVPVLDVARAKEALVNWRWRELRVTQQVRRCIVDALTAPFGIMKIGYALETEKVDPPTPDEALAGESGEELEVNQLIKAESPFAVRWSPLDVRVDPEARYPDLSDAGWIAFGWIARLEDLRRNPRFKNTRGLQPNIQVKADYGTGGPGAESWRAATGRFEDPSWERVQCWELWDKRTHERLVLADGYDKALELVDWPLAHPGFPAETLYFTEHPDTLYGPPDLAHVLGQQDAYNEVASMIHNHVRRFVRKYLAQRGAVDEQELEKLKLPVDGLVIQSDGEPGKSILPLQDAPIPVDWWQTRLHIRDDHDRVSGIGDFVRGVAEKVDTATEATFIQSNLNVRTNDTRSLVEGFAARVATQLLLVDAQTLDVPRAVPVIGPDGAVALGQFISIADRRLLEAEVDVEVEIGSMQPLSQQLRKQDLLQVYQLFRNDPLVDQFELRRRMAGAFHDTIPDLERVLIPKSQFQQVAEVLTAQMAGGGPRPPSAGPPSPGPPGAPPAGLPRPRPGPGMIPRRPPPGPWRGPRPRPPTGPPLITPPDRQEV